MNGPFCFHCVISQFGSTKPQTHNNNGQKSAFAMRIALCLPRKRFGSDLSVLQREKKLINTVAVKTDLLRDEAIDINSLGFSSRSSLQLKLANKINLILIRKTAHILSMPASLYFT